jgi:hypothetical protein
MTDDFAPLLIVLIVGVYLGVLALAFAIGVHDTRCSQEEAKKPQDSPARVPDLKDILNDRRHWA